jgi:hypothetical protein
MPNFSGDFDVLPLIRGVRRGHLGAKRRRKRPESDRPQAGLRHAPDGALLARALGLMPRPDGLIDREEKP